MDTVKEERIGPWVRRSRRTVYENRWMAVYEDQVTQPDGREGIYGTVHFRNQAVGVVAIDSLDRVLLVGQHRYPLDQYSWEIPAGGCPRGEDTLEAARRELREETGYSADCWRLIACSHLSNSVTDEEAFIYLASGMRDGEAEPEGTESLDVQWVPFEEALRMSIDGRITDSMTLIGLQRAALVRYAPQLVPADECFP